MQSAPDLVLWKQHIRTILTQIDGLQSWFEREQRALSSSMSAQLGQIEAEIRQLEVEAAPTGNAKHASRTAAQIEVLKARGDVAYDLFLRTSPQRNRPDAESK